MTSTSDSIAAKSVRASFGCPTNVLEREPWQIVHKEQEAVTEAQQSRELYKSDTVPSGR
jgi:hypothetical protein